MDNRTIANLRLQNQQLTLQKSVDIHNLAANLGAVQAQDAAMAKWVFGSRVAGLKEPDFDEAINSGALIRTHVMRPTWHLVPGENIGHLLDLTAPALKKQLKTRHAELDLTPALISKCFGVFEKVLSGGNHLTKDELTQELANNKINADSSQMYHLLFLAEIEKLICSGKIKKNKHSYALFYERINNNRKIQREDAIYQLAKTYFSSRGPANIKDFSWWSGLGIREASLANELVGNGFSGFTKDNSVFIYPDIMHEETDFTDSAFLLPAFDEFLICYADRSAVITLTDFSKAISSNGIFRPIIVINGEVAGIWKRETKKDTFQITLQPFKKLSKKHENMLKEKAESFGRFYGREIRLSGS